MLIYVSVTVIYSVWILEEKDVHGPHRHAVGKECTRIVGKDQGENGGEVACVRYSD